MAESDVIVGTKAIADVLGVTPKRVAALWACGAPIKRLGDGHGARYLASTAALRHWVACLANVVG